ncbi:MAG: UDP-N-acetylmuramoyl-tripeptide--D-alanyl-D-alanine ligase [Actinomycetota bacterium]|nr:UDP-N-acetylmuramoyl-tripeptide--D-alanyl-D-alanine ligase [Actinomycetota bacterium]
MNVFVVAANIAASLLAAIRWLRVAQREHYLAPSTIRFAFRWWRLNPLNAVLCAVAVAGAVASFFITALGLATAVVVGAGPLGLTLRGRTGKLAWTRRLRTVAAASVTLTAACILIGSAVGLTPQLAAVCAIGLPILIDLSLLVLAPIERALAHKYVTAASSTLERIDPIRVAVTGSYGKTTIKGYVKHLVSGTRSVVASPASFNNTAGLSRAVNEHLTLDTEVFVAEMGTYGPGEIASMVSWIRPSISLLSAIGPVHLERFGDIDTIVKAKSEIFATSRTAILNIDAHGLAAEADRLATSGIRVLRCSAENEEADFYVTRNPDGLEVRHGSRTLVSGLDVDAAPTNLACAIAAASVLGVTDEDITARLPTVPVAEHRRQVSTSPSGITVIDDTYNSNPAGAAAAVATLDRLDAGRKVVVTPGMVELGKRQRPENERFGEAAARVADDLVVVGRTNHAALVFGARDQKARLVEVATREEAVAWVRDNLEAGDAVLYENDLPDHFA